MAKNPHHPGKKPYYLLNGVEKRGWWVFGDFVGRPTAETRPY